MVAGGHWLRGIIQRVGGNTIKQQDALRRYPEDVTNENGTSNLPQRNSGRTNHPCHANGREPRADAISDRGAFLLLPAGIPIYL